MESSPSFANLCSDQENSNMQHSNSVVALLGSLKDLVFSSSVIQPSVPQTVAESGDFPSRDKDDDFQEVSLHVSGDVGLPDLNCDSNPNRTRGQFRPSRSAKGAGTQQLQKFAQATLGHNSLRKIVKLPEGEDINEWLAVNVVDFYNQINLLYGSITEFCSPTSCPEMKATEEFEYLWQDSENFKRPTKMPAPEYIEHLMAWCQSNIDNEQMFPSRLGVPFPKTFPALVRNMFKRLFRVYAHIYCHHYPVVYHLGLDQHLNTSFSHFVLFVNEHELANAKDYWGPLSDWADSIMKAVQEEQAAS